MSIISSSPRGEEEITIYPFVLGHRDVVKWARTLWVAKSQERGVRE